MIYNRVKLSSIATVFALIYISSITPVVSASKSGLEIVFAYGGKGYILNVNSLDKYKLIAKGETVTTPIISPKRDKVLYEKSDTLYIEDISTSKARKLFQIEFLKPWGFRWSPDGSKIAFFIGGEYGPKGHIIVVNSKTGKEILGLEASVELALEGIAFDWSNNNGDILVLEPFDYSIDAQRLLIFNLKTASKKILKEFKEIYVDAIASSLDGEKVAFYGNIQGVNNGLFILDLNTKKYSKLTHNDFGVDLLRWLKDGRRLIWNFCQSAQCNLTVEDTIDRKTIARYGNAEFIDFSLNEDMIYYLKSNVSGEWGVFVDNIPPIKEIQIFGNPIITQKNVENSIHERIKNFNTFENSKKKEVAKWIATVLTPPFGETFKIQREEVIREIGESLIIEKDYQIKGLLITALEGVLRYGADIYAIPYLVKILEDENLPAEIRAHSARSLGWSHKTSTVPYLVKFTKERNNEIRKAISWSLFAQSKRDKELMLPFLIEAIKLENDPDAIQYFAWTLRNIKNKNAIPALKEVIVKGTQRKDKSISYVIEALVVLDKSNVREILLNGSEFERELLGEYLSSIQQVDSSFTEVLTNKKESSTLRREVITLMRQEGEKWPYKIERILKDRKLFNFMNEAIKDEKENILIRVEAERILAIFKKQQN